MENIARASNQTQEFPLWWSSHSSRAETNKENIPYVTGVSVTEKKTKQERKPGRLGEEAVIFNHRHEAGEGSLHLWTCGQMSKQSHDLATCPWVQGKLQHDGE